MENHSNNLGNNLGSKVELHREMSYWHEDYARFTEAREHRKRLGTPDRLFELARTNPVVSTYVTAWRHGDISWDNALISIIMHLVDHNEKLVNLATLQTMKQPVNIPIDATTPATGPAMVGDTVGKD